MTSTIVRGLTKNNVAAINETIPVDLGVSTTSTTATFNMDAADAHHLVCTTMESLPGRGHPRQSLHAVARKLNHLANEVPREGGHTMASTTEKKETAAQRAKRLNEGGGKASSGAKASTGKGKTSSAKKTAAGNGKVRHIDIVAKVITDLGGKAKLADVAKVVEEKKLIPNLGDYAYRKLYGIILRDKTNTVVKAGKGEFKVPAKKS